MKPWLSVLLLSVVVSLGGEADRFPNVLLIISDDQAWGDYGFMGHHEVETPQLDKLASESLVFHRAYTTAPLCRPALASIITGLYPHQHGVTGNDPALPKPGVNAMTERQNPEFSRYYETMVGNFRQQPNMVRDLVGRGYVALQTGKWWEGDPVKVGGFTAAMTRGEGDGARHGDDGLKVGREGLEPVESFIKEAGDQPWLVWYAPFLPHAPHTPPEDLLAKYLRRTAHEPLARYWACVEWFDRTCGDLLELVEREGEGETIVIYTTDNGWIQDEARMNRYGPRSKQTSYEGGVRTPLMIRWPGHVQPRVDRGNPVSNIDIWPTVAAMLGVSVPGGLPGISLLDAAAVGSRGRVFGEQYAHDVADVDWPTRSLQRRWVVDGWWKLMVGVGDGKVELYHLESDPAEVTDLAAGNPSQVLELLGVLDGWWDGGRP
ncbi:MAG: sulfatase-like hydrolase/transferase [Limisphaerales bacterium]|jgi:arylsulfatase A-like enzyme